MASLAWAEWVSTWREALDDSSTGTCADNDLPGYPMAKNLRQKIQKSDTMVINDVNDAATQKFVEEVGNVTIAKTVREVAEQTVRSHGLESPCVSLACSFQPFPLMMFKLFYQ